MTIHDFIDDEIRARSENIQNKQSHNDEAAGKMPKEAVNINKKLTSSNAKLKAVVKKDLELGAGNKRGQDRRSTTTSKGFVIKREGNTPKNLQAKNNHLQIPSKMNKTNLHSSFESVSRTFNTSYMQTPIDGADNSIGTGKYSSSKKILDKMTPLKGFRTIKLSKVSNDVGNSSMDATQKYQTNQATLDHTKSKLKRLSTDKHDSASFIRTVSVDKSKIDKGLSVTFSPIVLAKSPGTRDQSADKESPTFLRPIPKRSGAVQMAIKVTKPTI